MQKKTVHHNSQPQPHHEHLKNYNKYLRDLKVVLKDAMSQARVNQTLENDIRSMGIPSKYEDEFIEKLRKKVEDPTIENISKLVGISKDEIIEKIKNTINNLEHFNYNEISNSMTDIFLNKYPEYKVPSKLFSYNQNYYNGLISLIGKSKPENNSIGVLENKIKDYNKKHDEIIKNLYGIDGKQMSKYVIYILNDLNFYMPDAHIKIKEMLKYLLYHKYWEKLTGLKSDLRKLETPS